MISKTALKIEIIFLIFFSLFLILSVYPVASDIILDPPQIPRDFTSDGAYFSVSNQLYATNQSLAFEQIVISDNHVQFNNTGFYVNAPNDINISIDYINPNIVTSGFGDKVLAFYVNISAGNVHFNLSGFPTNTNYSIYKDDVLMTYDISNSTGFITFTNSIWSEKYFEMYDNQQANAPQFISIDGGINRTTVFSSTPTFNWTLIANTSHYYLQISNVSDFSYLTVNLSNVCDAIYPTEYSENTTRVSFQLPVTNALSVIDTYYCRIRAYSTGA